MGQRSVQLPPVGEPGAAVAEKAMLELLPQWVDHHLILYRNG
jgi:hypothetical protein